MNKTKIEWCDYTWNPVTGCTPISEGCQNCYARTMARRFDKTTDSRGQVFKVALHPDRLDEPLKLKKPAKIFVCSMGDLFHEDVPDEYILSIYSTMRFSPQHTFIILTKRIKRMYEWYDKNDRISDIWPLPNVWLGVTCENQKAADQRIPLLLQIPAAKRFVSGEPCLSSIDLVKSGAMGCNCESEERCSGQCTFYKNSHDNKRIDLAIIGGETGPGARECREEWVQSIYDQCQAAGVPFFFKQKGHNWRGESLRIWESKREWPK